MPNPVVSRPLADAQCANTIAQVRLHQLLDVVLRGACFFDRILTQRVTSQLESAGLPARQLDMNEVFVSKVKDEMRAEYRREDLGKGVRSKYFARVSKGTNLVLLDDKFAKSFPTGKAVNQALLGLLALTEQTARITGRANQTTRKWAAV